MSDIEARYDCPVCLGTKLLKLDIGNHSLILDFCRRCGGIWFDHGELQALRRLESNVIFNRIELKDQTFNMQCHSCHHLMKRNASNCKNCGWKNEIDCPVCAKLMNVKTIAGMQLDYCKSCKGVWFDNIELSEIWNGVIDKAAAKNQFRSDRIADVGSDTASFFVDILAYDPGILIYGAEAGVEIGKAAVEASASIISKTPEIAGSVLEGTGELTGAALEGTG